MSERFARKPAPPVVIQVGGQICWFDPGPAAPSYFAEPENTNVHMCYAYQPRPPVRRTHEDHPWNTVPANSPLPQ
jgi:hypothetical protein